MLKCDIEIFWECDLGHLFFFTIRDRAFPALSLLVKEND